MPIPNVTISAPIMPTNARVSITGLQKASQISQRVAEESRVSTMGNGSRIGTGEFQQSLAYVVELGERSTSRAMEQAKEAYSPERLGSSLPRQANERAISEGMQATSQSVRYTQQTIRAASTGAAAGTSSLEPLDAFSRSRVEQAYQAQAQLGSGITAVGGKVNIAA